MLRSAAHARVGSRLLTVYFPIRVENPAMAMASTMAPPTPSRIVAPYMLSLEKLKLGELSPVGSFTQNHMLKTKTGYNLMLAYRIQ